MPTFNEELSIKKVVEDFRLKALVLMRRRMAEDVQVFRCRLTKNGDFAIFTMATRTQDPVVKVFLKGFVDHLAFTAEAVQLLGTAPPSKMSYRDWLQAGGWPVAGGVFTPARDDTTALPREFKEC